MFLIRRDCDILQQTRSLAREQFLKMALEKKIAKGMGLILDEEEEEEDRR